MENRALIEALYNAYAGNVSEMTAITQYFYQSVILNSNKELYDIFEKISIQEMRHLEKLATILKDLNVYPALVSYPTQQAIPWNASFVDYNTDYISILVNDIKDEKTAINDYNHILTLTTNPKIIATIQGIIEDELNHIRILENLLPKARQNH